MADDGRRFGRRAVVAGLVVFALPPVVLVVVATTDLSLPAGLVMGVVLLPLVAVTVALALIARQVASSPDEPVLIDDHVAEKVGMTSEEYEELMDQ